MCETQEDIKVRKQVAVFDFDGTLYNGDSLIDFSIFSLGWLRVAVSLIRSLPKIIAWKLGLISNSRAKEALFSYFYCGKTPEWFCAKGLAFADEIEGRLKPDIYRIFLDHIAKGHRVYIVSASCPQWIRPWADQFDVVVIGTEPQVENHCLTGRFATPNCYGAEKLRRLRFVCPDIDDCETWAYGDSAGDTTILDFATHAVKIL